ncbi:MAG: extracellular solute-binding protein [Chloroflexi bacterium]|nr:extracellular solute-binding protein [Chloroflexota bacterium]
MYKPRFAVRCVLGAMILALLLGLVGACAKKERGPLVVLEWSGYEQPVFWKEFAAKHPDVKVDYVFFAEDAEAYAKLQSGFVADLVHPHIGWLQIYVENDLLQPIDTSKLKNWKGIMPELAAQGQYKGKQYLVPWEWGYDSILVRTDKVKEVPDSWADIWDPQYAGHVSIYDSAEAAVIMTAVVLGYDPWNMDDQQLEAVKKKLIELKPNLLGYWTDYTEINQQVASGEVWLGVNTWPDAYVAVKAQGVPVEYITPKEGRMGWIYGFAIPKSAKNPDLAHDYIDAMISVESMAEMANQYGYGAANAEVAKLTDPELVKLFQLDQPDVLQKTIFFKSITEEQRQKWTTLWDEVKAAP